MFNYTVELPDDIKIESPEQFTNAIEEQLRNDQVDMKKRLGKNFTVKTHRIIRRW